MDDTGSLVRPVLLATAWVGVRLVSSLDYKGGVGCRNDSSDQLYQQAIPLDLSPRPIGCERRQTEPRGGSKRWSRGDANP